MLLLRACVRALAVPPLQLSQQSGCCGLAGTQTFRDQFQQLLFWKTVRARPDCDARRRRGQRQALFAHKTERGPSAPLASRRRQHLSVCLCYFNKPSKVRKRKRAFHFLLSAG